MDDGDGLLKQVSSGCTLLLRYSLQSAAACTVINKRINFSRGILTAGQ